VPALLQARQAAALGGSIAALMEPRDALLFLDWPAALLLALLSRSSGRGKRMRAAGASAPPAARPCAPPAS